MVYFMVEILSISLSRSLLIIVCMNVIVNFLPNKGTKMVLFPYSLSIFGNKPSNNVIQDFFDKVKAYFLTQILFFLI